MIGKIAVTVISALAAGSAQGQTSTTQSNQGGRPKSETEVVVDAPDRQVCRAVRRTATRMRVGRVCRSVAQWEAARQGRTEEDEMAEAADRLDALGADDAGTNDQRNPMDRTPDTPLGPRGTTR